MSGRPTLLHLRVEILDNLDDAWRPPTYFQQRLGLGGSDWYRVCLVLERLAADGHADLKAKPGSGRRWFRRAA